MSGLYGDFDKGYTTIPETDCWWWIGGKHVSSRRSSQGEQSYGYFKGYLAHRASYELHKGRIPEGLLVRHICDNPSCVNPDHLVLGLIKDNMEDRTLRNGHYQAKGSKHGGSKLTEEDVIAIRELPGTHAEKSVKYGVSKATIAAVRSYKIWKHV